MDSLSEGSVDSGCFMVTTSQREEQGLKGVSKHHQQLFNQLTALRTFKPDEQNDNNNINDEVIFTFKSPLVFWKKCNIIDRRYKLTITTAPENEVGFIIF